MEVVVGCHDPETIKEIPNHQEALYHGCQLITFFPFNILPKLPSDMNIMDANGDNHSSLGIK